MNGTDRERGANWDERQRVGRWIAILYAQWTKEPGELRDPKLQRAYEADLRIHRQVVSLAYKLRGGRLNDPPKRKPPKQTKGFPV